SAAPAFAHGEHGDAGPPAGASPVTVEGYQVELLTAPQPPRAGEKSRIIAKIARGDTMEAVSGGRVAISVAPVERSGSTAAHNGHAGHAMLGTESSWIPVAEMTYAGSYTLERTLEKPGAYKVQVALAELDGKSFSRPIVIDFRLNAASSSSLSPALLFAAVAALGLALVGVGRAAARSRSSGDSEGAPDLLRIRWLDRFVRWQGFQPVLQIPVLILTALLAFLGFADIQDDAKNLATRLTWIVWWPGIIFTFILVGRFWCVMCPFGALNEWTAKWAKPKRMFPKALRNLWLATFLFVLLTWFDEQLGIIRSPFMTASLIVLLASLAVVTGLFYQRRSFCRYLCPMTGLQGLYSMLSPVALRVKERSRCQTECHQDCYRGNGKSAGCPMFEFPMTMERNTYCNFCFECVKSCPPGNIALQTRPFGKELWSAPTRRLDEAYLAVTLIGITSVVSAQMLGGWSEWVSRLARLIPLDLRVLMRPVTYLALTESAVFFILSLVLVPALVLAAAWAAAKMAGDGKRGVKETFVAMAGMFIPIGLAMHLAHNSSHLLAESSGIIPAVQRTLNRFTPFDLGAPVWEATPIASADAIHWLEMLLILAGLAVSLAAYERLSVKWHKQGAVSGSALIPFAAVALIFTVINLILLNQPMAMRHGM
ncbi:MAG TPA: 4Fe-4S binding protein, partial [Candidatus Binatia bacterium]